MFLPLLLAENIAAQGIDVCFHATSRSCIDVIESSGASISGGIISRYKLHSIYDAGRLTYIYNLQKYNKVFIVTDTAIDKCFRADILGALTSCGNTLEDIHFITMIN